MGYDLGHPMGLGFPPFLAAIKCEVLEGPHWTQECYFRNKMHIRRNADGSSELHKWDWGSGEERQAEAVGGARHDVIPERAFSGTVARLLLNHPGPIFSVSVGQRSL